MASAVRLQVVGGGRMGEALAVGLVRSGALAPRELRVVEPVAARRAELAERLPGTDIAAEPGPAAGTVIAVKPGEVAAACRAVAASEGGRVLSIAAGVTTAAMEGELAPGTPVVRAMPNTPVLVGLGASAIAAGGAASEADLDWAEGVLGAVGTVVRVPEGLLDAVTGLSGSGPAYLFLVAEALIEAGAREGLPASSCRALVVQTLLGAASLLAKGEGSPEDLRAAVTSPGGATAAGLAVLEERGVRAALLDAVAAAAARSREMGM